MASFFFIDSVSRHIASQSIAEDLEVGARVFDRVMEGRKKQLYDSTFLLTMDYAFKNSIVGSDTETLNSIVMNFKARINADIAALISLDNQIMSDTLNPDLVGKKYCCPEFIDMVDEYGEAFSIVMQAGKYYQLVGVPILAPDPIAWLTVGFQINGKTVNDLKNLVLSNITILSHGKDGIWTVVASTFSDNLFDELQKNSNIKEGRVQTVDIDGEEYVSLLKQVEGNNDFTLFALLQRSMSNALKPYYRFRMILIAITITALLFSILLSLWISKTVTTPVRTLVEGVVRVEYGDYGHEVNIKQRDELGMLAEAFNKMMRGLEEKKKVHDLLGKVVSAPIAHELLSKQVELGGEEREVTIIFSDMRNFTTLSENRSPVSVLNLLNVYLTQMSDIVESYGGVVDKYIGDAVMALFGAPLGHADDVNRALYAAIDMIKAKDKINMDFERQGLPKIDIGIGINTDIVVAGNMGSTNRLNYTVIGDGVNVASRLEGLTKEKTYNANIIISEAVYKKADKTFKTRFLGEVSIKGKKQLVSIYALDTFIS
ncbi:MAG: HAMP domain-containing protein [Candidatus Magnetoovum sp. WYHC-5]|nr:HAMP domain-containing protein [Candidatus Magnetoovum sp. WYHC-5]